MDIMNGVYRNLNAKRANNGADLWSIGNGHTSANGHLVIEKGITHGVEFGLVNVITNNPQSITKGCQRIARNHSREVVAIVGGDIVHDKPMGALLGRLTLDIPSGTLQIVTDSGRMPFNGHNVALWFGEDCQVYKMGE